MDNGALQAATRQSAAAGDEVRRQVADVCAEAGHGVVVLAGEVGRPPERARTQVAVGHARDAELEAGDEVVALSVGPGDLDRVGGGDSSPSDDGDELHLARRSRTRAGRRARRSRHRPAFSPQPELRGRPADPQRVDEQAHRGLCEVFCARVRQLQGQLNGPSRHASTHLTTYGGKLLDRDAVSPHVVAGGDAGGQPAPTGQVAGRSCEIKHGKTLDAGRLATAGTRPCGERSRLWSGHRGPVVAVRWTRAERGSASGMP